MADELQLPLYGVLWVNIRLQDIKTAEVFVISQISKDAILGMPFLTLHRCSLDFGRPVLSLGDQELVCTDWYGRLLLSKVQLIREVTIPPNSEMVLQGRITNDTYPPVGLVEAQAEGPMVATSFNQPDNQGHLPVRCLNPTGEPWTLKGGTTLGSFTGVSDETVQAFLSVRPQAPPVSPDQPPDPGVSSNLLVPDHFQGLYELTTGKCTPDEAGALAQLLTEFASVFNTGDLDTGLTKLVTHGIPIKTDTRPIRQPPHRLGPEKEAEAERQIQTLLNKGLIEPAN